MKKNGILWMGVVLMLVIGMSSCSSDDNFVVNPKDDEATEQDFFYYYNGGIIPLTLNENNYCIYILKECDEVRERVLANVRVLETIGGDNVFNGYIVTRADYKRLTAQGFWKEDKKSVVVTATYFEEGKLVASSPYLSVKLKKKEDEALLTPYAEKYKLKIVGSFSQYFPLYYNLYVTPESEKSPLECANIFYESGEFEYSQPDLMYAPFINTSGDIEEHEVSPEEIPEGALNQTTTEFTGPVWKDVLLNVSFDDTPVEERPKTAAEFYNRFIGEGVTDCFKCIQHNESGNWVSEYYQQYYRDVIVKITETCFFFSDGKMTRARCYYLPIKDFDVTPKFDKWVAYEIFKSFMKLENYYEDRCELQIVSLPEGDSVGPRLVYEVKKGYTGLVIDARSGRALYRTSYDW